MAQMCRLPFKLVETAKSHGVAPGGRLFSPRRMPAFGGKADIDAKGPYVRFDPKRTWRVRGKMPSNDPFLTSAQRGIVLVSVSGAA